MEHGVFEGCRNMVACTSDLERDGLMSCCSADTGPTSIDVCMYAVDGPHIMAADLSRLLPTTLCKADIWIPQ